MGGAATNDIGSDTDSVTCTATGGPGEQSLRQQCDTELCPGTGLQAVP